MEKQTRDELKLVLRDKLRQKQDLEEKQAYELKVGTAELGDCVR